MNRWTWIGWLVGILIGVGLAEAIVFALEPGLLWDFVIGMVFGLGCSQAGLIVGTLYGDRP